MLVLGSNTAKQAALTALLDPSTHFRPTDPYQPPPTSTGRPQPFQSFSDPHPQPFQVFLYVRFSRFRRFFSRRFSAECWRGSHSCEARGHISVSFDPQRSNKGPSESSRQGAHDRAITPNPPTNFFNMRLSLLESYLSISDLRCLFKTGVVLTALSFHLTALSSRSDSIFAGRCPNHVFVSLIRRSRCHWQICRLT
jgi:hypothetical protein